VFLYSIVAYAAGLFGLGWLILTTFRVVPLGVGPALVASAPGAVAVDLALVALFGVQHTIMARPAFKAAWARVLPAAAARATFTGLAGGLMALALGAWQPIDGVVWHVELPAARAAVHAVTALGWAYLLAATFAIDHFELFGLRQAARHLLGRPPASPPFSRRLMYRFDRHPIMTGFLVALWATPTMTASHLLLAAGFTAYAVLGVAVEERDLIAAHGESYREYKREVGALVPTRRADAPSGRRRPDRPPTAAA
ncbi:MAG: methyltransferase family protein, partial [Planctomycetota bacterium JB042]